MDKLYIFYGDDEYRVREAIRSMASEIAYFDLTELDAFFSSLGQQSLFGDAKTPVLLNVLSKLTKKQLQYMLESNLLVILWEQSDKIPEKSIKEVKKKIVIREFKKLRSNELFRWINQQAQEMGLQLAVPAQQELVRLHGANLFILRNELQKIHLFVKSSTANIVFLEELPKLGVLTVEANLFSFLDAVGERDVKAVTEQFAQVQNSIDEWVLMYQLVGHLRKLLKTKLGEKVSNYSFVNKKLTRQAAVWEEGDLIAQLKTLLQIEFDVKRGMTELTPELMRWVYQDVLQVGI